MLFRMLNVKQFILPIAAIILLTSGLSKAQRGYNWDFGVGTGLSNYLGDIGGREKAARPFISDMKLAKSRWNQSLFARYKFDPLFAVKFAMNYLRIEGDDALSTNPGRKYRNLSFRNDIFDFETTIQFLIYNSNKPAGVYSRSNTFFTAYLFGGVGGFYHNPKAVYQGQYVALQPLKTEGVEYSKWGYCLPFGAGFYVTIKKRKRVHRIGLEINWRYTNTDYLDDISTVYINPTEFTNATSLALYNRNPELERQPEGMSGNYGWHGTDKDGNPVNRAPRGDPSNKDSFLSINASYAIAIKKGRWGMRRVKGRKIRTVSF
jgi:hypothetical protein